MLESLPPELLVSVFELVALSDLCALACVSSALRALANDDSLWRHAFTVRWPCRAKLAALRPPQSWKTLCRYHFKAQRNWHRKIIHASTVKLSHFLPKGICPIFNSPCGQFAIGGFPLANASAVCFLKINNTTTMSTQHVTSAELGDGTKVITRIVSAYNAPLVAFSLGSTVGFCDISTEVPKLLPFEIVAPSHYVNIALESALVCLGHTDHRIEIRDLANLGTISTSFVPPGPTAIISLQFWRLSATDPHPMLAIGRGSGDVQLVDLRDSNTPQTISTHRESVLGLYIDPLPCSTAQLKIYTGSSDGTVRWFDIRSVTHSSSPGKPIRPLGALTTGVVGGVSSFGVDEDEQRIVTNGEAGAIAFDMTTGDQTLNMRFPEMAGRIRIAVADEKVLCLGLFDIKLVDFGQ